MDDPVESDVARSAKDEATSAPSAPPDGLGFRLRIGGTERPTLGSLGTDPARPVTGELPTTGGGRTDGSDPIGGGATTSDDWEGLPDSVRQDEVREYRTDLDVQRFIAELADQIAASDGGRSRPDGAPAVADVARSSVAHAVVADPVASTPVASRPVASKPAASRSAASKPAASKPAASTSGRHAEPVLTGAAAVTAAPAGDVMVAVPNAAVVTEPAAVATAGTAAAVVVPGIVEATAAVSVTGQQPVVPAAPPAAPITLPAAQLLPRIEATPGAPRPTKPVDFRSLLGDSGVLTPSVKRKTQRRPFRFLFKAVLVLALLGGGAYAVKRYYLDARWAADVEAIADDVADRRGLSWDDAVEVVVLERNEYALRLASTVLGVDLARAATLGGEWRAMGLAEGSLDLVAVGSGALADRPAFYDPVDGRVYQVAGLSAELREIALSRALASALLDQHFHWGDSIATASPSVRLGVLALFDGDAMAVQTATVGAVLADEQRAADATAELAQLRLESAPLASGAPPYAVAITGLAGVVTQPQFSGDLALNPVGRNAVLDLAVTSDAAIVDGARGRSAVVELPAQATTTAPPDGSAPVASSPATVSAGVIGAASGAAAQTEGAIQETMGAAAEVVGTTLDPATTAAPAVPADAGAAATTLPSTTSVPTAAASATTRGLVYWYYVLAGRLDPARAWTAALQWQGDLTSVDVSTEGLCVSSIVTTADVTGRDVLLGALTDWAAGAPAEARTTVAAASDTEIELHSCDPGPSADTYVNGEVPLFGNADEEQIVAFGLLDEGLPRSEAARACVFRAVREIGVPALLESKTLDRSLTQRSIDPTAPQVNELIARCGNE